MDSIDKFEESMKVLDILSLFINKENANYIKCDEIREPVEKAFQEIYEIYQNLGDDSLDEEIRDRWEKYNNEDNESEEETVTDDDKDDNSLI
jgi:hypothetical protein